jgi:hypothetical protein
VLGILVRRVDAIACDDLVPRKTREKPESAEDRRRDERGARKALVKPDRAGTMISWL